MTTHRNDPDPRDECEALDERLTHYALDEIDGDERRRVEDHLEHCAACQSRVAERTAAASFLASTTPLSLSNEALEQVEAATTEPAGSTDGAAATPMRPWFSASSLAASVLVLVLLGVLGLTDGLPTGGGDRKNSATSEGTTLSKVERSREVDDARDASPVDGAEALASRLESADAESPKDSAASAEYEFAREMTKRDGSNERGVRLPAEALRSESEGRFQLERETGIPVDALREIRGFVQSVQHDGSVAPPASNSPAEGRDAHIARLSLDPKAPANGAPEGKRADEAKKSPEAILQYGTPPTSAGEGGAGATTGNERWRRAPVDRAISEVVREVDLPDGQRPPLPGRASPEPDAEMDQYADSGRRGGDLGGDRRYSRELVERVCRYPNETPSMMFFRFWGDNPFLSTLDETLSTFGLDVDTASYTLVRRYLRDGHLPPRAAIRTEEFVNAFPSNYTPPTEGDFAIYTDLVPSVFSDQPNVHLLKVGIKARELAEKARQPLSLTLVVDVSGSMAQGQRLELVKQSISTLLAQLRPDDSVAIVTFNTSAQQLLPPTSVRDIERIAEVVRGLSPNGSTNLDQGMTLGYTLASQQFRQDGMNRVLVFSDGVANTGRTTADAILAEVLERRRNGIFLNTYGVGMGNHNDALLEQLADRGDGQCAYIDHFGEAVKLFQRNLMTSFMTIAKDAKVQVSFDPKVVRSFRQIGYENRAIAHQDFRNDSIDAGEVNAGHEVIALYEVEIPAGRSGSPGTVALRYQQVSTGVVAETQRAIPGVNGRTFDAAPDHVRLSACAVAFAELLRASHWSRGVTPDILRHVLATLHGDSAFRDEARELGDLLQRAERLGLHPVRSAFVQTLDKLKETRYQAEKVRDLADKLPPEKRASMQEDIEKFEMRAKELEAQLRKMLEEQEGGNG